jgi:ectoine hydroxylase-related dioxygenase (phytanoyl-CoA dioxygenase family)
MVDGYYNKVQQNEILKWHSDQAYDGVKKIDKIFHPDYFHLKFFFYLSEVGPNNGCTSYIPGSHKITHAVRSCLYEGKIDYEPFWEITDLVNVINKKNNYIHIVNKLGSEKELINFLDKANLVLNKENSYFDFKASPGDLLIFNEGGIHRGSKPSLNERVVLRYLYL